ncbi:MAG: Gmad2 immunoglobulin-like domain-containing protein [Patescibacteria group bacterium]
MKKISVGLILLVALGLSACTSSVEDDTIAVSSPAVNSLVQSPLEVTGKARGQWFFEGSFPIEIVDANGEVLGQKYVQSLDNWMTEDFVDFRGEIEFSSPKTETGTLILSADNPSGLPQNDRSIEIPVIFKK